ncbi:MAG: fructosamine kinase family protein [Cyanobacteria bacterium P01_D01_bin.73]
MWDVISGAIARAINQPLGAVERRSVGGGCINQAYCLTESASGRAFFVKLNRAERLDMFEAEALGLQEMRQAQAIAIPKPLCWGVADSYAYIVLEWLELGGRGAGSWEAMGRELAAMHRWQSEAQRENLRFGWTRDNTIGATPQPNGWMDDWAEFFRDRRLEFQLKLARRNGGNFPWGDQVLAAVPKILAGHDPQPSILHGDLWSGNAAIAVDGQPVIFDPATYWGDREADLAMTELFGGFPAGFYRGYNGEWPLDVGYEQRKTLYNLYHILNHFNLLGGGYASQANAMVRSLL